MTDEARVRAALDRLVAHTAAELDLVDEEVRAVREQARHDLDDVLREVGIEPRDVTGGPDEAP